MYSPAVAQKQDRATVNVSAVRNMADSVADLFRVWAREESCPQVPEVYAIEAPTAFECFNSHVYNLLK